MRDTTRPERPAPGSIGAILVGVARALMTIGLRGADREFLRGDLDEELRVRLRHARRPVSPAAWYLGQAVRSVSGRGGPRSLHRLTIHGRWQGDRKGDGFMRTVLQDLRYSVRALRKEPGFAVAAVLTLGLGLGATSSIFAMLNGLLLRPLPYGDASRLVMIQEVGSRGNRFSVNYLNFLDFQERADSFSGMALHYDTSFNLATDEEPVRISGLVATGELFDVLGVEPILGRSFVAGEDGPGAPRVVLISHALWHRSFAADPAILGREITLHGRAHTVIGVMPEGFHYPEYEDVWLPQRIDPALESRGNHYSQVVARLGPGVTLTQAEGEMRRLGTQLAQEYPDTNLGQSATALAFRERWVGDSRLPLLVFQGVVVFVLLIATVNVGNLLLARAATRRKEIAVRSAIGASRARLLRQLLTESLLLASVGGALGLLLGKLGRDLILGAVPIEIPRWMDFSFDLGVVAFMVVMTLITGVVFGLVPSLYASRDLNESLKHGGDAGAGRPRQRLRGVLVVAEVALALILLVGAGLMMRGLTRVQQVDPGLDPEGVLTLRVSLPVAEYEAAERSEFFEQAVARLRALPGVIRAGGIGWLPFTFAANTRSLLIEGAVLGPEEQLPLALSNVIVGDYADTLGIPLLRGRWFIAADDHPDSARVAVITEQLAERHWPDDDALGKRLAFGSREEPGPWMTVVGIAGDVRHFGLDNPIWSGVYVPHGRAERTTMMLTLKTEGEPLAILAGARRVLREMDAKLPAYEVRTMDRVIAEAMWEPKVYSWMFGVFAAMALGLAAIGLYGVMAFSVGRRTQEIGIRMALGAAAGDVLRLVVRQAMVLVAVGVVLGLIGAAGVSGVMSSMIYGVSARDPFVYLLVAAALVTVALVATLVPGSRATRVDPILALREE